MKVLITSGATREPIDEVRYITNFSSGKTGAILADIFKKNNWEVTYVYAKGARLPEVVMNDLVEYTTFDDLNETLKKKLNEQSFDVIVHASAVSDYRVSKVLVDNGEYECIKDQKISSDCDLTIKLKKNPKIIASLYDYSKNKKICIVGFKLTSSSDKKNRLQKIEKVGMHSGVKLVVHNDVLDIKNNKRDFFIYKQSNLISSAYSEEELGIELISLLKKEML